MKRAAYDCVGAGAPAGGAVGDDELSKPFSLLIELALEAASKCSWARRRS